MASVTTIKRSAALGGVLAASLFAGAASATVSISEDLNSSSTFAITNLANGSNGYGTSGDEDIGQAHYDGPIYPASADVDYQSTYSGNGSFAYLHNSICFGTCTASVTTVIQDTITNTGTEDIANLIFTTHITAGRLAFEGAEGGARFAYDIQQIYGSGQGLNYAANAIVGMGAYNQGGDEFSAFTYPSAGGDHGAMPLFNNLQYFVSDDFSQHSYTWDATDLSFSLGPLAVGQSIVVQISSLTSAFASGCDDLSCGAQAVFGDPRNSGDGGGGGISAILAPDSFLGVGNSDAADSDLPFIGRSYGLSTYTIHTVAQGANGAVPEPASWAMMLAGFGLSGAVMRRRKPLLA